jgi:4-amino-4-deoxy-L-arabinose transferase-like glycosyltransferase
VRVLLLATAIDVAVMIKGVAGLSVPLIAAGFWLFCSRSKRTAAELVLGLAVATGVPIGFELWHRRLTGQSFWLAYLDVQVLESVGAGAALADKAYNLFYYFFRPFWFFFPWMFLFTYGLVDWLKNRDRAYQHTAWLIGVVVYAVFTLGFSLADRKAERYILPMYPAMALGVAWLLGREALAVRPVRWLHRMLERHQAKLLPSVAGLVVVMLVVRVYISAHHHIDIRLWPGNTDHLH